MRKKKERSTNLPLIDEDGEVREITAADMKEFRPAREVLPPEFFKAMEEAKRKRGRPPVEKPKRQLTLRLPADVIDRIKASGSGYNTRIMKVLIAAIERGEFS